MNEYVFTDPHCSVGNAFGSSVLSSRKRILVYYILPDCYLVDETSRNQLLEHFELQRIIRPMSDHG